ncbi:MAG TPA: DUF1080 domain-containing protein [Thermoanaerobaculia bacterium]|nr:DUF1080 domain-containing protein [Thermoanaerobaculia bacterium]
MGRDRSPGIGRRWAAARRNLLGIVPLVVVTACLDGPSADTGEADGWTALFNGSDLSGWRQVNGTAEYRVEDGAIVGVAVADSPNSFLATEETFSDFVLELDFLVEGALNSGIQVRSESRPEVMDGRVHGYQVEIDPSARAWSAGIYDEARRGWLFPMTLNPGAGAAFRPGEWNRLRVEARGPVLKTWINGVPAAYLIDEQTAEGFVALQVHAVGSAEEAGQAVRWRDLRIRTAGLEPLPDEDFPFVVDTRPNRLSEAEAALGWRLLWDGATTAGWRGAHAESFPQAGWEIADGALTVLESGGGEAVHGGDIVTEEELAAFELQVEFRLSEGANSGIKYFVTESYDAGGGSAIGLEYQLLDDARHPDASQGRDGNRTLGSLYDLIPAVKQPRFVRPPGEWNHARLVVRPDRTVEHWLNHQKVLEYVRESEAFLELVAISKYRDWEGFGRWERGRLLLQDHGNRVSFRSIKLRELASDVLGSTSPAR